MTDPFTHGQEVVVLTHSGAIQFRGRIQGVHQTNPWHYDVLPSGEKSLKALKPGIPHDQIRLPLDEVVAYERGSTEPRMVKDDA